jgi:hypothetical protein
LRRCIASRAAALASPPEPWHTAIVSSWERIFNLDGLATDPDWWGPVAHVQVTFEYLRLKDVRHVDCFVAR